MFIIFLLLLFAISNNDTDFDYMLSKASSCLHILHVCKYYGFSVDYLDLLFKSLILSIFTYAIEVWVVLSITNTLAVVIN